MPLGLPKSCLGYFFFCPLVSSWLKTDAARDFISFLVGVFLPDKTLEAKVEVLLDDCFLAIFYLHAKSVKDRGVNRPRPCYWFMRLRRNRTLFCRMQRHTNAYRF